LFIELAV